MNEIILQLYYHKYYLDQTEQVPTTGPDWTMVPTLLYNCTTKQVLPGHQLKNKYQQLDQLDKYQPPLQLYYHKYYLDQLNKYQQLDQLDKYQPP